MATNCKLFPTKAMVVSNEMMKKNNEIVLSNLIGYKKELKPLNIYSNLEINELCESYYTEQKAEMERTINKYGILSCDELIKIHHANYKRGGIYSNLY